MHPSLSLATLQYDLNLNIARSLPLSSSNSKNCSLLYQPQSPTLPGFLSVRLVLSALLSVQSVMAALLPVNDGLLPYWILIVRIHFSC
jgi:hypothetical protein